MITEFTFFAELALSMVVSFVLGPSLSPLLTLPCNQRIILGAAMEEYDVPSAASILASVKEQEARFERLTRALEEERRNVSLQLERGSLPSDRLVGVTTGGSNQPLAWQQMVMQVNHSSLASHASVYVNEQKSPQPHTDGASYPLFSKNQSICISFSLCCVWLC